MNRVFVTGGSGFLGQQLIADLVMHGTQVVALARSEAAAKKVTAQGAEAAMGDLLDKRALTAGMAGCDTVIHSAAHMEMGGPYAEFRRKNITATKRMLAAARAAGVTRFVLISAAPVVKGAGPIDMADETWPRRRPAYAPYLKTKSISDQLVCEASRRGFQCMSLRPPLIWGPGSHMLAQLVDRVNAGQWMWLGSMRFPYATAHLANVSKAAILVAEKGRGGEAYNITDGEPVILRDFLSDMIATQGADAGDRELPYPVAIATAACLDFLWGILPTRSAPPVSRLMVRLMGQQFTVSDRKIRDELGFENAISVGEGMEELADFAGA